MFRENVLTDDEIIHCISTTMVPVAVDRWKADDPSTPEARFLQPFLKEHPPQGSPCIYAPDGTVLGGFQGFNNMVGQTKTLLETALAAFGPVKPRHAQPVATHPYRGMGVMPDGRVVLAEYIRPSSEALAFMNTTSPVISSVTLTREEFAALAPGQAVVGATWSLPEGVAKKFSRITSPMCYQHAPQPAWVNSVRINAEVQTIKDNSATLHYQGRIASEHRLASRLISAQTTRFSGEGVYDLNTKTMKSVVFVGTGDLSWPESPEKLVTFDALVEWVSE